MAPRHRIVVFHEDERVFQAVACAAQGSWRCVRARSVRELEGAVERTNVEIVVTDGHAHDGSFVDVLRVIAGRYPAPRVLLCLSRLPDPATLVAALGLTSGPVHLATVDVESSPSLETQDELTEVLYGLRLAPYAAALPALCVAHLRLKGTPFESLPARLVKRPRSCRRVSDTASALGLEPASLLSWSRELQYEQTRWLLFRIRAQMAGFLAVTGLYSWPEARETFGELDGSNFRRSLARLELTLSDLKALPVRGVGPTTRALAPSRWPGFEALEKTDRPQPKTDRVGLQEAPKIKPLRKKLTGSM